LINDVHLYLLHSNVFTIKNKHFLQYFLEFHLKFGCHDLTNINQKVFHSNAKKTRMAIGQAHWEITEFVRRAIFGFSVLDFWV